MCTAQTGGGAATHSGTEYQNRVAAWFAVRILAETASTVPFDYPSTTTIDFLRCETLEPVDDSLIGVSTTGHIFLQAKHRISLGTTLDSELASVMDQFVRQFHAHPAIDQTALWKRPLDKNLDRLILATTSRSSAAIRQVIPTILGRIRSLSPQQRLDTAAVNEDEQEALKVLKQHTKASWNALKGVDPTDEEITQLLSLIRVLTLDVDPAETHEREAKDLLRQSVLKTPSDTDTAYSRLVAACATFAANRTGANRAELQAILVNAGIDIEGVNSFQADIQKLQEASVTNLQALSGLSEVRLSPTAVLKIARDSTSALKEAVERESLVVVGQPGAGKTGALYDLANGLAAIGDVLVFGVDHFEAKSLASLRIELGCTHDVLQVLGNWPGLRPGFLIIDALDAARTDLGAKTFRELIAAVLALNGRWRVIPSIRKYDLRHSSELKSLFVGAPHSTFHDPEFGRVKHIEIPVLSDAELTEVGRQSPELGGIVAGASPALKQLLRIPFNLRLCAEMLGAGAAATAISPVKTQIDLLNLYWRERVLRSDQQGDARESVLRTATSKMVEGRTLRIPRSVVAADPSASTPLHQILSSQLLIEWQQSPRSAADRYILAYSHHILYDYAISRLLLRGPLSDVLSWLETQPDLMLAIRPSLMFHYQHLWTLEETRDSFWEYVFSFFKSNTLPDIGKIIGPLVAAQLSSDIQDFQPLINAMRDNNSPNHEASKEAFRHLLGAAHSENSTGAKPLVGENAPPWAELLKEVASI